MSRRRQSAAEDVIDIAAALPWWVGLLLALLSYLILHQFADITFKSGPVDPGQLGATVASQLYRTLAYFGQFLLPSLFLIGALASKIKQVKRRRLYASMEASSLAPTLEAKLSTPTDPLTQMSWSEFEQLIAEFFTRKGFSVKDTPPGPDNGIDLYLEKNGKTFIVQCKHWKTNKVTVQIIREQFGIMHAVGAHGVYVVTSGTFTEDALQFAESKNIMLIDGSKLRQVIVGRETPYSPSDPQVAIQSPECPSCGSKMILRTAKRGRNQGSLFWGCTKYPQCKGTVSA